MAEAKKLGKRKGASIDPTKTKKAKVEKSVTAKPSKAPVTQSAEVKPKTGRKRAVDFLEEDTEKPGPVPAKKPKSTKSNGTTAKPKADKTKAKKEAVEEIIPLNTDDNDDVDLDGFTSSEDGDSGSESEGDSIPDSKLPQPPKVDKKVRKEVAALRKDKTDDDGVGVLYIGRIPHGFYEHQMRHYFSQFGNISRLRLARNRRTGRSRHYSFVEFESAEVADIVQRVMDKYLMFGHLLQVRRIPQEQVHENLFKGANSRFKRIPWGDMQMRGMKAPAERGTWERRVEREEKRREEKKKVLEEYGYEFEMPGVKQVRDLPSRSQRLEGKETKLIAAAEIPAQEDAAGKEIAAPQVLKKEKKVKKPKTKTPAPKEKKSKKAKSTA